MEHDVISQLTPHGVLRAGINLSNFLLVTGRNLSGDPEGIAPDMAREIAARLGVAVAYVPFASPGELADAAGNDIWDIALIGAEPQRAQSIGFTPAYVEIEASYLVPATSEFTSVDEVDQSGVQIAVTTRSAYGLWLARNIEHAALVHSQTHALAHGHFVDKQLDALAGLKPQLLSDVDRLPGARILDGRFTVIQQAVGVAPCNEAAYRFLCAFIEEAKASGLIARLIERHRVRGLAVAPLHIPFKVDVASKAL
jgi:polar amino acid transport system substrate-binding protein